MNLAALQHLARAARTVPVPGVPGAVALDPHDLAAVKLLVARDKDIQLVAHLLASRRIDPHRLKERLDSIEKDERLIVRAADAMRKAFAAADIPIP